MKINKIWFILILAILLIAIMGINKAIYAADVYYGFNDSEKNGTIRTLTSVNGEITSFKIESKDGKQYVFTHNDENDTWKSTNSGTTYTSSQLWGMVDKEITSIKHVYAKYGDCVFSKIVYEKNGVIEATDVRIISGESSIAGTWCIYDDVAKHWSTSVNSPTTLVEAEKDGKIYLLSNAYNSNHPTEYNTPSTTTSQTESENSTTTGYDSHSQTNPIVQPSTQTSSNNVEYRKYEDDTYIYEATIVNGTVTKVVATDKGDGSTYSDFTKKQEGTGYGFENYWTGNTVNVKFSETTIKYNWTNPSNKVIDNSSGNTHTGSGDINPDNYNATPSINESGEAMQLVNKILGLINIAGAVILVITVVLLGLKYMTGSIEEKAEYKRSMLPILFGSILLFATSTIINVVYNIVIDVTKNI